MFGTTRPALAAASLFVLASNVRAQTCESYGIDFQNGGSYFQNISSTAPFTFVSIFEGCQNDTANNILVDPNGDEYQCSDTSLLPSDTNQLSTCPIDKDEMYSGDWSVVLISNNGEGDPIAYERDFYLTVGVPVTTTFTPTVTLSSTSTPLVNSTTTVPNVIHTTVNTTITSPAATRRPTTTLIPKRVTVTDVKTVATIRKTRYIVKPSIITHTHIASCVVPRRQQHPDPTCSIKPTLVHAAALETKSPKAFRNRRPADRAVPVNRNQRIAERKARLAHSLEKRAPDNATVTITDTNTADYATTTFISTAAASTLYITTSTNTTTTMTNTLTTYKGVTTLSRVTITKPTPTQTRTIYTVATATVATRTLTEIVPITITVVPAAAATICRAKGGQMR